MAAQTRGTQQGKQALSDIEKLAKKYFQLELPTTAKELKSAFKRESTKVHPDIGGDPAKFRRLRAAYEILLADPHVFKPPTERLRF